MCVKFASFVHRQNDNNGVTVELQVAFNTSVSLGEEVQYTASLADHLYGQNGSLGLMIKVNENEFKLIPTFVKQIDIKLENSSFAEETVAGRYTLFKDKRNSI